MDDALGRPFTKAEMEAIREANRSRSVNPSVSEDTAQQEAGVKRNFWKKLRRVGGRIPFAEDLVAAFFCATDSTTPNRVRLILMGAIAYFILPTDAVADFLPFLGFADDAAVLAAAISQVAGSITDEHRAKARMALEKET